MNIILMATLVISKRFTKDRVYSASDSFTIIRCFNNRNIYKQDWPQNLCDPMQNENSGSLVKNLLRFLRWWQQNIKPNTGPVWQQRSHTREASPVYKCQLNEHVTSWKVWKMKLHLYYWIFILELSLFFPASCGN